jgi:uncharacterized protein YbjQ (UPF0145 family)
MLTTTTPTIDGRRIREYRGIVTGEAILGTNVFRDFFAGIRDIIGGRSGAYEKALRQARDIAIREMCDEAASLGANAVVGIDLDYETIEVGDRGSMMMVSASGTAVVVD